jgi:hypothetical protein
MARSLESVQRQEERNRSKWPRLTCRATAVIQAAFDVAARARGVTRSALLKSLIVDFLKRNGGLVADAYPTSTPLAAFQATEAPTLLCKHLHPLATKRATGTRPSVGSHAIWSVPARSRSRQRHPPHRCARPRQV